MRPRALRPVSVKGSPARLRKGERMSTPTNRLARPRAQQRARASRIRPLVRSISCEIEERCQALQLLEAELCGATTRPARDLLLAEAAVEARELERSERELERLGCSIAAWWPLTIVLERLLREPLSSDVSWNSIIAIGSADPDDPESLADADDGVVEYTSAHLDGVESEALVPGPHSCQSHPATIRELRRILRAHVGTPP